jgi:hypothetical protein
MNSRSKQPIPSRRGKELERKIKEAVQDALLDHQRAGNPVAIWQDGKVVIVPPSRIPELLTPTKTREKAA